MTTKERKRKDAETTLVTKKKKIPLYFGIMFKEADIVYGW